MTKEEYSNQIHELQTRLREAEDSINAIRDGAVDAIVVSGKIGEQVYTLQGADRSYRLLIESISEGALTLNADGTILYCNRQFAELVGLSLNQIVGNSILNYIADAERQSIERILNRCSIGIARVQASLKTMGGDEIPVQISMNIANIADSAIIVAAIITDLTERKQTERSLKEREILFRGTFEQAAVGIAHVSMEGRFIRVNQRFCDIVGYGREELLALTFHDITYPADLDADLKHVQQVMEGATDTYAMEKRYVRKNGDLIWVNLTAALLREEAGNPKYFISVVEDITKRKMLEEELERHRKHLEDMVEERTRELESKSMTLQEVNAALKVLLRQREEDKKEMEERFVMNVRELILPYVEQLKKGNLGVAQQSCLETIQTYLREITTPLLKNMRQLNLTPKETRVALLVKQGKSTKEIAEILGTVSGSVAIHRKNIRKKLGLSRKENLPSHLDNLQ